MHRIDTPTAKQGRFVDGNPHKPNEGKSTHLNADWFNGVQENICNAVTKQGISLKKGDDEQLHNAIVASSYRLQILSHLRAMVEFLTPVSSEISLPSEVNYDSDPFAVTAQLIDALGHISSESVIPAKPNKTDGINGLVRAVNILITGVENQSDRPLNLAPIVELGA